MSMRAAPVLMALLLISLLSACATRSPVRADAAWQDARQLVLVSVADWNADHGTLQRFERGADARWRPVGEAVPVTVGRSGTGWGTGLHPAQSDGPQKREGDGRAPAGVFALGTAFGYADRVATAMPYVAMEAQDWCIDVSASPLYNRIVDTREVGEAAIAGSTEPMRRDIHVDGDQRYKLGLTIGHNPRNVAAGGSCIFAHLWQAPGVTTAGCTAMAEPAMQALLQWLQPQAKPVFVLLPQAQWRRLAADWQLPAVH